jgi:chromosomal replication initiation ATPase DnaA
VEKQANRAERTHLGLAQAYAAHAYGVPLRELKSAKRLGPRSSRARQVAMYLAHVVLGVPQADVAASFRRGRSTMSHTCRRIEALREDPEFDRALDWLEAALKSAAGVAA